MELFCNLTAGIDHTPLGNTLKDHIVSLGIVEKALEYVSVSNCFNVPMTVKLYMYPNNYSEKHYWHSA